MKKSKANSQNYLDKIPLVSSSIEYKADDDGIVTLQIHNKGIINRIAQILFFKPKVSYIHLDELGSYSVLCADGKRSIFEIGKLVKNKFGQKSEPLYERLSKFFQIMDSYKFIQWK